MIWANKFDNEGIIEFTCNHGYKLIGPRVLRCDSGKWNNNIPSCRRGNRPNDLSSCCVKVFLFFCFFVFFFAMNFKNYMVKYKSGCQFSFSGRLELNDGEMAPKEVLSCCSDRMGYGIVCYILKMNLGTFFS